MNMSSAKSCLSLVGIVFLFTPVALGSWEQTQAAEPASPSSTAQDKQATAEQQQPIARPRQMLLDVRVVTMKPQDLSKLGIWRKVALRDDKSAATVPQHGRAAGDKSKMIAEVLCAPDATSTDSLWATVDDLEEDGRLPILATPQIIGQNGREALLRLLAGGWCLMAARTKYSTDCGARLAKIEASTAISITPHIGDGSSIIVKMVAEVSDRLCGRGDAAHEIIVRQTEGIATTIETGGTVAWAGLTRYGQERKHPAGLAGLPLIGGLFRNSRAGKPMEETVIFVTVHLIPEFPHRTRTPRQ